jgi:hypothetical protein
MWGRGEIGPVKEVSAGSGHVIMDADLFDAIARIVVIISSRWRSTTTVGWALRKDLSAMGLDGSASSF